jgi:hypothetical protein
MSRSLWWARGLVASAAALAGCQPSTTRPVFAPVPEAATTEIRLSFLDATRRLAEELRADSLADLVRMAGRLGGGVADMRRVRTTD